MIGKIIHNYRIESLLGQGGMGVVYKGIDLNLQRPVAVKVLHPHLVKDSIFYDRFKNEAVLLAKLNHPNITTLYNYFSADDQSFMVMEYVEGVTLEDHLREEGRLPLETAVSVMIAATDGLQHAHQKGILHRDIKPANIMISPTGVVKLMDFGIAKMKGTTSLTKAGNVIGTLEYMAPELLSGEAQSEQSELYAMGVIMYEMLTGKLPYQGNTEAALIHNILHQKPVPLRKVAPENPKELERVLNQLLEKKPNRRSATAGELKEKLKRIPFVPLVAERHRFKLKGLDKVRGKVLESLSVTERYFRKWLPVYKPLSQGHVRPVLKYFNSQEGLIILGGVVIALLILLLGSKGFSGISENEDIIGPAIPPQNLQVEATGESAQRDVLDLSPKRSKQWESSGIDPGEFARIRRIMEPQPPLPIGIEKDEPISEEDKSKEELKVPPRETKESKPKEQPEEKRKKSKNGEVQERKEESVKEAEDITSKSQITKTDQPDLPARERETSTPIPEFTEFSVHVDNLLVALILGETLSSDESAIEGKTFVFRVLEKVSKDGVVIVNSGAKALGRVTKARSSKAGKRAFLEIQAVSVEAVNGDFLDLSSTPLGLRGSSTRAVVFHEGMRIKPDPKIRSNPITIKQLRE